MSIENDSGIGGIKMTALPKPHAMHFQGFRITHVVRRITRATGAVGIQNLHRAVVGATTGITGL